MIAIPSDAVIRLHTADNEWLITIAPPDAPSDPFALITRRGCVSASLTHDPDVDWPDNRGESLASAILAQPGGAVLLIFATKEDARSCHERLLREAGR